MKIIIVGLGIQGKKGLRLLKIKKELFATVDYLNKDADYKFLNEVPLDSFDTAIISVHNQAKLGMLEYLIKNKKNIMVEKPFLIKNEKIYKRLKKLIIKNRVVFYTAYNHRFEPHIVKIRELLKKIIGKVYYVNFLRQWHS